MVLEDGSTVTGDVVIAADGVHSACRKAVLGDEFEEAPSAVSCFRTLIPTALLRDDAETQELVKEPGVVTEVGSPDRRIIFYPCSGGETTNVLATLPREQALLETSSEGNRLSVRERMLVAYSEFAKPMRSLLSKSTEEAVTLWELFDLDPLPRWCEGTMALMGDAAHPYSPFLAQGSAQAIEDAISLSVMLPLGTQAKDVPQRLQWYEECRKDHATKIQEYSRMRGRESSGQRGKPPSGEEVMRFIGYIVAHSELVNSSKFFASKNV